MVEAHICDNPKVMVIVNLKVRVTVNLKVRVKFGADSKFNNFLLRF